jgi:hypothetical protein
VVGAEGVGRDDQNDLVGHRPRSGHGQRGDGLTSDQGELFAVAEALPTAGRDDDRGDPHD